MIAQERTTLDGWPGVEGNGKFRFWFVKLAIEKEGKLLPAAFDCVNTITPDGDKVIFDDLKNTQWDMTNKYRGYSLVFTKDPADNDYIFRGVYVWDEEESKPNHDVNKRVATRVRLIGSPAFDLELLDDAPASLTEELFPKLSEYDPGITKEQYIEYFSDPQFISKSSLDTIYYLYKIGGEGSCKLISERYGNTSQHYNSNAIYVARLIHEKSGCPLYDGRNEEGGRFWSVLFQGRHARANEVGSFIWHIRQPLAEAMEELEETGFFRKFEEEMMKKQFQHNTILCGPPGTGKTYKTTIYAVAIIEEKDRKEIEEEARADYDSVKRRYEEYKEQGLIAFTTFHQSYGYEEFIEGIRPVLDTDSDLDATDANTELKYELRPGVFKEFCERAGRPVVKEQEGDYELNMNPVVWKVSLEGTGDNETRRECLANDHIRIGWDEYGSEINEKTDYYNGGQTILNAFINKMRIGDVVLSCYSKYETDAIGVITGDYEWVDTFAVYKRVRKVKWLVKNIRENIRHINNDAGMVEPTVYRMKINANDAMDIVEKHSSRDKIERPKNHVFIIDEINRGNISKIFGELITLIEPTKRLGEKEEAKAKLPYSGSEFGVPSNVYILGTMNTADRSIALMDTALRRRFSFEEMMPDADVLRTIGADKIESAGQVLDVAKMLEVINQRIEYLYDREHTIGHAFFTGLKDDPSIERLASIFEKSVIPLLQEYFYEDYEKIQLILGDDGKRKDEEKQYQFIRDEGIKTSELFYTAPDMEAQGKRYMIQKNAFHMIESYLRIVKG